MSPKGHPDYVTPVTQVYIEGLAGLEELASRLGSVVPFDLHGNIVLIENFESELTEWYDEGDGLGSTAVRSSRHKHSGDWSLKLYNRGVAGATAALALDFEYPGLLKYGLFARFCWDTNLDQFSLWLTFYDGVYRHKIIVEYEYLAGELRLQTFPVADYIVASDLYLSSGELAWRPILVTFDLRTGYYDKVFFDGREYDVSAVPMIVTLDPTKPKGYLNVSADENIATAYTIYADDIVLVKNVP